MFLLEAFRLSVSFLGQLKSVVSQNIPECLGAKNIRHDSENIESYVYSSTTLMQSL